MLGRRSTGFCPSSRFVEEVTLQLLARQRGDGDGIKLPREEHVQRPKERKLKSYTGPDRGFKPCQGVWTSC